MTTDKTTHSEPPPAFSEHPTQSPPKEAKNLAKGWAVIDAESGVAACDLLATEAEAQAEAQRLAALAMDPPRYSVVQA